MVSPALAKNIGRSPPNLTKRPPQTKGPSKENLISLVERPNEKPLKLKILVGLVARQATERKTESQTRKRK